MARAPLDPASLLWLEAADKRVFAVTRSGERLRLRHSLKELEDLLPSPPFARVPWPVAGRSRPGDAGLRSLSAPQAVGVASSASTKRA